MNNFNNTVRKMFLSLFLHCDSYKESNEVPCEERVFLPVMTYWKIRMCLHAENKLIETEDIKIQCGIFQGDSLSPLLFCICLIPLTEQLNWLNTGYEEHTTKTKISHLLHMDNLKLIVKSEEELQKQIQTVKTFSDDINMYKYPA